MLGETATSHYLRTIWEKDVKKGTKDEYINFYKECIIALQQATANKGILIFSMYLLSSLNFLSFFYKLRLFSLRPPRILFRMGQYDELWPWLLGP